MPTYAYINRESGSVDRKVVSGTRPTLLAGEHELYEIMEVADDVEVGMSPGDHPDLGNAALILQAQAAGIQ